MSEHERIEIDGAPPSAEHLRAVALDGYGHFTAMQVRSRRVRGIDRHLDRLTAANSEMFGTALDPALVRDHIRHALGDDRDASVRVYVREADGTPLIMVTVRPPGGMPAGPWKLMSVPYQRTLAHLKHLADFGQRYYQRLAYSRGYDEALLTGADGNISEGSITNNRVLRRDGHRLAGGSGAAAHHHAVARARACRTWPAVPPRPRPADRPAVLRRRLRDQRARHRCRRAR
jgi:branched-subunit amino acid aminotransferase/4-amino-4-deoxychorismate lyase